jgi:hypothetical protein
MGVALLRNEVDILQESGSYSVNIVLCQACGEEGKNMDVSFLLDVKVLGPIITVLTVLLCLFLHKKGLVEAKLSLFKGKHRRLPTLSELQEVVRAEFVLRNILLAHSNQGLSMHPEIIIT